jgi:hypothetical protein
MGLEKQDDVGASGGATTGKSAARAPLIVEPRRLHATINPKYAILPIAPVLHRAQRYRDVYNFS